MLELTQLVKLAYQTSLSPLHPENPVHLQWLLFTVIIYYFCVLYDKKENHFIQINTNRDDHIFFIIPKGYFRVRYFVLDLFYGLISIFAIILMIHFLVFKSINLSHITNNYIDLEVIQSIHATTFNALGSTGSLLIYSALFVIFHDFMKYLSHRMMHEIDFLWQFHKIHHDTELLTPITIFRIHPVEPVVRSIFMAMSVSIFVALSKLFFKETYHIYFFSVPLLVLFSNLYNNFSHTHIWIHWPYFANFLRSPAMHQVHHEKHHYRKNVNYSNIFSIWDYIFNTIENPKEYRKIHFGINSQKLSTKNSSVKFKFR